MMPTQDFQTALSTEPAPKSSVFSLKRVFLVIMFIFWSLSLLVLGVYFGEKLGAEPYITAKLNRDVESAKIKESQPVTTDSGGVVSGVPSIFQKTLNEKCGPIIPGDSRRWIRLEDLPIRIDTSVLKIGITEGKTTTATNAFLCFWGTPGKDYAFSDDLSVYDINSEELVGHGGAAYFGFAGVEVPGKSGVRLGVRLTHGDAGPSFPGDTGVVMRGVRSINLSNGEQIFISADEGVIGSSDSRLVEFLKKYSEPIDSKTLEIFGGSPGDLIIEDFAGAERAVAAEFFGNGQSLGSQEREKVNHLLEVLSVVYPK